MNERIKELAEQAGMVIIDDEFSTYGKFAEKFSELIVKECIDIANAYVRDGENVSQTARSKIGIEIQKHFGVEE